MTEFYHLPSQSPAGQDTKIIIASGPVIIEDGKVLLDKHGADNFWKFPGGRVTDNKSFQEVAIKEAQEELGLDIEIISKPFIINFTKENSGVKEYVILIHYLAKRKEDTIKPGSDIKEWAWHDIDNLPDDLAPNIKPVIKFFT